MSNLHQDRVDQLIALCIRNNLTPANSAFVEYIRKACATRFGLEKNKAKPFVEILVSAWRGDKWKYHVHQSSYLTKEEIDQWIKTH
jgi:hypothetical protein